MRIRLATSQVGQWFCVGLFPGDWPLYLLVLCSHQGWQVVWTWSGFILSPGVLRTGGRAVSAGYFLCSLSYAAVSLVLWLRTGVMSAGAFGLELCPLVYGLVVYPHGLLPGRFVHMDYANRSGSLPGRLILSRQLDPRRRLGIALEERLVEFAEVASQCGQLLEFSRVGRLDPVSASKCGLALVASGVDLYAVLGSIIICLVCEFGECRLELRPQAMRTGAVSANSGSCLGGLAVGSGSLGLALEERLVEVVEVASQCGQLLEFARAGRLDPVPASKCGLALVASGVDLSAVLDCIALCFGCEFGECRLELRLQGVRTGVVSVESGSYLGGLDVGSGYVDLSCVHGLAVSVAVESGCGGILAWPWETSSSTFSMDTEPDDMDMDVEAEADMDVGESIPSSKRLAVKNTIQTNFADDYVFHIASSPEFSTLVVSLSTNTIKLYSPVTGQFLGDCKGHHDTIHEISFSTPSSPHLLCSCSSDATVRTWDTRTFKQFAEWFMLSGKVFEESTVMTSDSTAVITNLSDTFVRTVRRLLQAKSAGNHEETLYKGDNNTKEVNYSERENSTIRKGETLTKADQEQSARKIQISF
ncbi:hypothetical protein KSP39_PZI011191 [Platanthera zijinensis]|uniref:Uncharacterized protein n=1 Tax=Platanthera zijinensis TaxID=2320716 RepID=A0AAP0G5U8_9ASPA